MIKFGITPTMQMRHIFCLFSSILLFCSFSPLSHAQLLQKGFETTYEVHHNSIYLGETKRTLFKAQNDQWEYTSSTTPLGLAAMFFKDRIEERSVLEISTNSVKPLTYSYNQSGGKREQKFQFDYHWDTNILTNTFLNKDLELVPGTQDLLSFVLQIMVELQKNRQIIELQIADKRRIDDYQLKVIGNETIETPFKTLPTVVLLSNKIRNKMQFKIWCAPSLQYLPIRIQKIEEDGDEDTMSLKQLKLPAGQVN